MPLDPELRQGRTREYDVFDELLAASRGERLA
jgi:hypothetical protein